MTFLICLGILIKFPVRQKINLSICESKIVFTVQCLCHVDQICLHSVFFFFICVITGTISPKIDALWAEATTTGLILQLSVCPPYRSWLQSAVVHLNTKIAAPQCETDVPPESNFKPPGRELQITVSSPTHRGCFLRNLINICYKKTPTLVIKKLGGNYSQELEWCFITNLMVDLKKVFLAGYQRSLPEWREHGANG